MAWTCFWRAALAAAAAVWASVAGAEAPPYRLPYPDGEAHRITQAPGGWISTHVTRDSRHAVDIAMPEGTPVLAARGGVVIATEWRQDVGGRLGELWGRSNFVRVRHADGSIGTYAHLMRSGVAVEVGEAVRESQVLGYAGTTGFSSGPHLHFAVTRLTGAGEGNVEEVSEPITFYVGRPPLAFTPRVGMAVRADYSTPAEVPRSPNAREAANFLPRRDGGAALWSWLVALLAAGAGLMWFYRFSRS